MPTTPVQFNWSRKDLFKPNAFFSYNLECISLKNTVVQVRNIILGLIS